MSLSFVSIKFKKTWAWIKKNWQLFVGISIPIVVYLVTRKPFDMSEVFNRVKDDYEKELSLIKNAHEEKDKAKEAASKRYQSTLSEVEKRYDDANQVLDSNKRKEVEEVLKNYSNDPDEITKRISELTGFDIYVSE